MIKVGKVVGINTDQKAALSSSSSGEEGNQFLAILELSCDDAFTKGRQILSELSDMFFDSESSPAQSLTEAAETLKQKLTDTENFSFLLASLSGKALYLIGEGSVSAKLYRNQELTSLDISSGQLVSGFLEEGDRVLLSTQSLIEFLAGDLGSSLNLPLTEWEEEITEKLRGEEAPTQAGLIVDFGEREFESLSALPETATVSPRKFSFHVPNPGRVFKFLPKSGRGKLILAALLIVILTLGIGFQFKQKQDAEKTEQFNVLLQSAKSDFEAAKGLANLDPGASKEKLASAKDSLNKALAIKQEKEALELKKQIEEQEGGILQQFAVSKLPEFLDLSLIKDGFKAENLSLSDGKILLLDKGAGTLVSVDLSNKSNQVLAGKDALGSAQMASINGENIFVYSSSKGVVKVAEKKTTTVAKEDEEWGSIVDLAGFASNVYLLDKGKNQIWKYLATSTGFSDKREYLLKEADLSNSIRMQIESSVYVLKSGGEILRFTKGEKDNFSLSGLDKGIKDPKSIFASSDADNFYILDSGNSRVVVTTKTGAYKAEYQADQLSTASDLVVDEKNKKVYILDSGKIYTLDLK
jgi:hypothetical protein